MHVPLKQHDTSLHQTKVLNCGLAWPRSAATSQHWPAILDLPNPSAELHIQPISHTISELPFRLLRLRSAASKLRGAIAFDRLSLDYCQKPPCAAGDALFPAANALHLASRSFSR